MAEKYPVTVESRRKAIIPEKIRITIVNGAERKSKVGIIDAAIPDNTARLVEINPIVSDAHQGQACKVCASWILQLISSPMPGQVQPQANNQPQTGVMVTMDTTRTVNPLVILIRLDVAITLLFSPSADSMPSGHVRSLNRKNG